MSDHSRMTKAPLKVLIAGARLGAAAHPLDRVMRDARWRSGCTVMGQLARWRDGTCERHPPP